MDRQLAFIAELDKLKRVTRVTRLMGGRRRENSAEHSWHIATMAHLLREYAPEGIDLSRVILMLLVHDVVEIDAGDSPAFGASANADKEERERRAADRLFGLLPDDQASECRSLWDEFEEQGTPEARFAASLDRFQGLLQNWHNGGGTWVEFDVSRERILERMAPVRDGAPALWPLVLRALEEVGVPEG